MGKPVDPGYWAKWRAAHPEYRAREKQRLRNRDRGDRTAERARWRAILRSREIPDIPIEHPLLDQAREIVGPGRAPGGFYAFPEELIRQDALQVAVLAMLEDRDPREAVKAHFTAERTWLSITTTIIPED